MTNQLAVNYYINQQLFWEKKSVILQLQLLECEYLTDFKLFYNSKLNISLGCGKNERLKGQFVVLGTKF